MLRVVVWAVVGGLLGWAAAMASLQLEGGSGPREALAQPGTANIHCGDALPPGGTLDRAHSNDSGTVPLTGFVCNYAIKPQNKDDNASGVAITVAYACADETADSWKSKTANLKDDPNNTKVRIEGSGNNFLVHEDRLHTGFDQQFFTVSEKEFILYNERTIITIVANTDHKPLDPKDRSKGDNEDEVYFSAREANGAAAQLAGAHAQYAGDPKCGAVPRNGSVGSSGGDDGDDDGKAAGGAAGGAAVGGAAGLTGKKGKKRKRVPDPIRDALDPSCRDTYNDMKDSDERLGKLKGQLEGADKSLWQAERLLLNNQTKANMLLGMGIMDAISIAAVGIAMVKAANPENLANLIDALGKLKSRLKSAAQRRIAELMESSAQALAKAQQDIARLGKSAEQLGERLKTSSRLAELTENAAADVKNQLFVAQKELTAVRNVENALPDMRQRVTNQRALVANMEGYQSALDTWDRAHTASLSINDEMVSRGFLGGEESVADAVGQLDNQRRIISELAQETGRDAAERLSEAQAKLARLERQFGANPQELLTRLRQVQQNATTAQAAIEAAEQRLPPGPPPMPGDIAKAQTHLGRLQKQLTKLDEAAFKIEELGGLEHYVDKADGLEKSYTKLNGDATRFGKEAEDLKRAHTNAMSSLNAANQEELFNKNRLSQLAKDAAAEAEKEAQNHPPGMAARAVAAVATLIARLFGGAQSWEEIIKILGDNQENRDNARDAYQKALNDFENERQQYLKLRGQVQECIRLHGGPSLPVNPTLTSPWKQGGDATVDATYHLPGSTDAT